MLFLGGEVEIHARQVPHPTAELVWVGVGGCMLQVQMSICAYHSNNGTDCILGLQHGREEKSGKEWGRSGPGGWMGTRRACCRPGKAMTSQSWKRWVPYKHRSSKHTVSQAVKSCMYVAATTVDVDVDVHLLRQQRLHPGLAG